MAWAFPARRSRFLLAALVFAHLLVISGQVDGGQGSSLLQRLVLGAFGPVERLVGGAATGVRETWRSYVALRQVREENRRLAERVDVLELMLQEKQDKVREAERLRGLLDLRQTLALDAIGGDVIARQGLPWFRSLVVNQGTAAGVRRNAAVLAPAGVVGRVVAVGPRSARVQLLLDRDCGVGVMIERSRVTGVAQGQIGLADSGASDILMKYVPALADVVPGDVVVTSGLDGIYPKGLLVGRVRVAAPGAGLFRDVLVEPAVAFDRVEVVLILRTPPESAAAEGLR